MYRKSATVLGLIAVFMFAVGAMAAGVFPNADFSSADGWQFPAGSQWSIANDDGHSAADSLRFESDDAVAGAPVIRDFTCSPNTDYLLSAWIKSDGNLTPTMHVIAPTLNETRAATVTSVGDAGKWELATASFNSGAATRLQIRIYADNRHTNAAVAPAGTVTIDDVQVWLAAEVPDDLNASGVMRKAPGPNIALGKPYTLNPRPAYSYSTDAGDATQLTDGVYSVGYFWVQPSTVGWNRANPDITIDLGSIEPITGMSFNTAAGVAGVGWPAAIIIMVSDDGVLWHQAGELVSMSAKHSVPAREGYSVYRYWTGDMRTHGRFVKVMVAQGTSYVFCDEIEVYRGDDALLTAERTDTPTSAPHAMFQSILASSAFRQEILADAGDVRNSITRATLSPARTAELLAQLSAATDQIDTARPASPSRRAILPYNSLHRSVMAVNAELRRAMGQPRLQVWQTNRWDPLKWDDAPGNNAGASLDIAMLRNEVRSDAFNIFNAGERSVSLSITISGLPGGPVPDYATVSAAAWTTARGTSAVADALPAARRTDRGWNFRVEAGMTRQVWIMIDSAAVPPGTYSGTVNVTSLSKPVASVPFSLKVSSLSMPDQLTLAVGGWDYTDGPHRGVTAANRANVVKFLKQYRINAPWATSSVMPFGKHDADGKMIEPPSTAHMDQWLELWKGAKNYYVFNAFYTPVPDTAAAKRRVTEWITFWANHLKSKGIDPSRLYLHIFDESHTVQTDRVLLSWSEIIREADTGVNLWTDPTWRDPRQMVQETYNAQDVLCPNRPMWIANRDVFEEYYAAQREAGRTLSLYSCSGPVRQLDPYTYHRLQAWDAFRIGATEDFFWAFGDNGGGSAWNEYSTSGTCYTPQFLDDDGCTTSRHMEAVREGAFDYEYLVMLRDAVNTARAAGRNDAAFRAAAKLLEEAPGRVLQAQGVTDLSWANSKDRSAADKLAPELIAAIESLTD